MVKLCGVEVRILAALHDIGHPTSLRRLARKIGWQTNGAGELLRHTRKLIGLGLVKGLDVCGTIRLNCVITPTREACRR